MGSDNQTNHSEHDFMAFCAKIENDPGTWETLKLGFSAQMKQREILQDMDQAATYLKKAREDALFAFKELNERARTLKAEAESYIFTDNDILLFANIKTSESRERMGIITQETRLALPSDVELEKLPASGNMRALKTFADEKMRTARQVRAISSLASDANRRNNIGIQRKNRHLPLVMLVEDDRFTASYATQLLSKDYEVFHVRTGEEAIDYYMDYAPDVVLIDVHLPGMSGTDTLQMIKTMDPHAYCIILSVDSSQSTVIAASKDGADRYLRKPYTKERLLWTVQQSPHIQPNFSAQAQT